MFMKRSRHWLYFGQGLTEEEEERGMGGHDDDKIEKFSVDDRSYFSLTDYILPSLGKNAVSNRRMELRRFIISPFDPRYRFLYRFPISSISMSLLFMLMVEFCYIFNQLGFIFCMILSKQPDVFTIIWVQIFIFCLAEHGTLSWFF